MAKYKTLEVDFYIACCTQNFLLKRFALNDKSFHKPHRLAIAVFFSFHEKKQARYLLWGGEKAWIDAEKDHKRLSVNKTVFIVGSDVSPLCLTVINHHHIHNEDVSHDQAPATHNLRLGTSLNYFTAPPPPSSARLAVWYMARSFLIWFRYYTYWPSYRLKAFRSSFSCFLKLPFQEHSRGVYQTKSMVMVNFPDHLKRSCKI